MAVDPETGAVHLLRFTTAHDVGMVLNPVDHQGQIEGAVVQSIGYALTEELAVEEGRVSSANFGDYKMPTMPDIPPLHTVLPASESGPGPYNTRGIGDPPLPQWPRRLPTPGPMRLASASRACRLQRKRCPGLWQSRHEPRP